MKQLIKSASVYSAELPFAVAPAPAPKTCLGCGAKFTTIPEGGLPCGH